MRKWMALGVVVCLAVGIGFASLAPGGKEAEVARGTTLVPQDRPPRGSAAIRSPRRLVARGPRHQGGRGGMRAEVSVDFPYAKGDALRYA
ncbi:hypothetical protein [Singulisphaera sp. PoT]|uniref:hypothetical protein n=1 Tax=Singulisphaera sp. PoT TaxID=3411797 RepID=UPI003BF4A040